MQNFVNNNYDPDVTFYNQLPDPATNEPFNKATHPSDKPIVAKHIFVIDSRQRNFEFYPNANNYNIPIPDRYRNVTSIELRAAMLPRTEYNVNSCNKYIDFVLGDFIKNIMVNDIRITIKDKTRPINNTDTTTKYNLNISPPVLEGTHITKRQAVATILVDSQSYIVPNSVVIEDPGSGYSYSKPPEVSLGDISSIFKVNVGFELVAKLREGQYVMGGNPQFTVQQEPITTYQSYTPNNLLNEIESSLTQSVLMSNEGKISTSVNFAYSRKAWTEYNVSPTTPGSAEKDYPLFFCARLMSQYPTLESYNNFNADTSPSESYETNACKFNRIYIGNILCFKSDTLPTNTMSEGVGLPSYNLKQYFEIKGTNITEYISFYALDTTSVPLAVAWKGVDVNLIPNIKFAHWELLFSSGQSNIVNSASLLGFNKINYSNGVKLEHPIEISHCRLPPAPAPLPPGTTIHNTLMPKGIVYSTNNDYYLFGDPEYIVLSFRPKYGGNTISGINDRVDSQPNSNIDRVFACLIFDATQPSVLQDMSSGRTICTINSNGERSNTLTTFQNDDYRANHKYPENRSSQNNNNIQQLTGNTGNQNVNFDKGPGMLKAMKGTDFDRKLVEFPQPIAQIFNMNIRFTKFTQLGLGFNSRETELYDFAGKEHLLIFEITCSDFMTGKRF